MTAMDSKYEYEFLIKYKNMSFMHVQWVSGGEIEAMSQKSKGEHTLYTLFINLVYTMYTLYLHYIYTIYTLPYNIPL
jgi:hypothetical protein